MDELNSNIQIIDATYDELFKKDIKQYDDNILYRLTVDDYKKFILAYINEDDPSLPRVNCISSYQYGYSIIYNTCGECYVESFDSIEKCKLYFEYPDIEIDDLYDLSLNEIVQKYDYLFQEKNTADKQVGQLYLTGLDDKEISKYIEVDFHQAAKDLYNLIDNIVDIYEHDPNNEIHESLYEHVENLSEVAKVLYNITPVKKEDIITELNKENEITYLMNYLEISKENAKTISDICYQAYLKSDDDISYSAIVTRMAEFFEKYDNTCSKYNLKEIPPRNILDAYYLLRDHDDKGALNIFEHANIFENKGIAERIKESKEKQSKQPYIKVEEKDIDIQK